MPTYTPARLAQAQPGTSYGTLYTSPAATSTILKKVVVTNVTGGSVSLDLSLPPEGAAPSVLNSVIAGHVIPPWSTVMYTFDQVMAAGGFIAAKASAPAALTVLCSGVRFGDAEVVVENAPWTIYAAALTATTTSPTLGTGGSIVGRYQRLGRLIVGSVDWKFGTAGINVGSGTYRVSLPVMPLTPPLGGEQSVASGYIRDVSVTLANSRLPVVGWQVSGLQLVEMADGYGKTLVTDAAPYVWAINDEGHLDFHFEAAA